MLDMLSGSMAEEFFFFVHFFYLAVVASADYPVASSVNCAVFSANFAVAASADLAAWLFLIVLVLPVL